MNKKEKWYNGELIAQKHYENQGFIIVETNYTIPWWEIDIIAKNSDNIVFVEVKVVDNSDDLLWYISNKKITTLERSIAHYCQRYNINLPIRMDLIYIKNKEILEIYENITNT